MSTRISAPNSEVSTLIDLLRWRADQQPGQRVYTFLQDGEVERDHLTFAELERRARGIGAALQEYTRGGERALLIYPPGLEFITAFFGCLYSGVIAVPVYPPSTVRSDSTFMRFRAIAGSAEPAVVLTTTALVARVKAMMAQAPELQAARLIVTDELPPTGEHLWHEPDVQGESLAFLQYTSGSTGTPKGVMVSHRNLLHNSSIIYRFSEHPPHAHAVIWLPQYHDMGLVAGILQPLYAGFGCTFMTPASFLQRPVRWLQTITRTRATITGGPNFAYELCVRKVTEEQKVGLDLSSLELATNGSEPVRAETQARFNAAFASCGLRPSAFFPGFGMAEATLVVSSNQKNRVAPVVAFDREQLEQHRVVPVVDAEANVIPARLMVSNGPPDLQVIIVEPEMRRRCAENEVGEIWVAGESVVQGYWRQPEETEYTFNGRLAGTDEGPYLRTGDMGFLYDGELYISGRLKDLIIIRGRNHYPQDIEKTVERCHPALRVGCVVAFALDEEGEERLVIVSEVERVYLNSDLNEVIGAIRRSIAQEHELQASAIVLLKTGTIPKTSSGKVQRRACQAAYLAHELSVVKSEIFMSTPPVSTETVPMTEAPPVSEAMHTSDAEPERVDAREEHANLVQSWLVEQVARELHVPLHEVNVRMPFAQYGMDSMQAVSTSTDLEDRFGVTLAATVVYDYPNIEALARYVAGLMEPVGQHEDIPAAVPQPSPLLRNTGVGDIALIGLGCRFPGADGPEAFWEMLRAGVDGIAEVPAERWDAWGLYSPERATPGKMNTRWGGFLKQIDQFDPYFFQISPREAARMDPQQRLLLEVAWEALEHAGVAADTLAGSEMGVFVGISSNDYSMLQFSDPASIDAYVGIGNAHSIAANRLSYVLDLRGPSVALDTACSSSLVAVHMACQSIRNGECDTALAGGVNVILSPELTITFSQARMMSDYGRCRTFDEEADGYVRSEGCGLVVLKGLEAARRDGDTVLAVIRGSAVNQDGRSNGITAPNGPAQEAVIRRALRNAGVRPDEVSYVETHGSSTPLGDPIEVESLKAVMMEGRELDKPLVLGSVKTNIGHLEAAAGIAGLIKTVLCLQHGEIPPHLHLKKLNQHISFAGTSFEVPTQLRAWETSGPRIAGVSAFGFGGTNAHVIVAADSTPVPALPDAHPQADERPLHILTLSARSKGALRVLAGRYADYLAKHAEVALADVCATTHTGRVQFAHRLAVVAASHEQMQARLAQFVAGREDRDVVSGQVQPGGAAKRRKLAFLFTGQGAQYIGMGRQLYEAEPLFRAALDRCDAIMQQYTGRSIVSIIYAEASEHEQASRTLNETEYTQPALFALEYALAELWHAWGIEPDVVMGHSVGEYVAACVAGMLSLEDGCKLIAMRGRLMQGLAERGEMAVVFADERRVVELLKGETDVEIATLNGPRNTVISGSHEAMARVLQRFEAEGEVTRALTVSHAFHSRLMEPMLDAFAEVAREVEARPLRLPLVCNVTGELVAVGERLGADYWRRQTREAVQFAAGMRTLAELGVETFLEIGPNGVLINMGMQCLPEHAASWLTSLRRSVDDEQTLLQCVATLCTQGTALNWRGFDGVARSRVGLPTYPFERERCWLDPPDHTGRPSASTSFASNGAGQESKQNGTNGSRHAVGADVQSEQGRHPLLTTHVELVHPAGMHVWETELETRRLPYLKDHRIQGAVAVPISMYIEMAQAATVEVFGPGNHMLAEIELRKLLLLPEEGAQKVQVILSDANEYVAFQVYSSALLRHEAMSEQPRGAWTLHATGKIRHT